MDNPYAAPTAGIAADHPGEGGHIHGFYVVSRRKLWALSILTFGLYTVAWGYKNWECIKRSRNLRIWPAARGIFIVFFIHALMRLVADSARMSGRNRPIRYTGMANMAVVAIVANHILDRMTAQNIGYPILDLVSIGMIFVIAAILWGMQRAINYVAGDEAGVGNDRFTGANWVWMVIGVIVWGLAVYGLLPTHAQAVE